jgi:hypothetical protein
MYLNVQDICRRVGLKQYELAALLGECHTSLSRLKPDSPHRPYTISFYWLLQHLSGESVALLLERWIHDKPKSEEQVRLLIEVARRFLHPKRERIWQRLIRRQNPEFFF